MTVHMYPPLDRKPWPTLGPEVCGWIEANLVHGPGDLYGQPLVLTEEQRFWVYRFYEVEPPTITTMKGGRTTRTKNPRAGRRRFQRCTISVRKGYSKTELAGAIAIAEFHEEAPVRCREFATVGGVPNQPVGSPVTDPYIPMLSYTEEQTEELGFGYVLKCLQHENCRVGGDFDIGLERIMRRSNRIGYGKLEAVAGSPNARDGARTTFFHADETHRWQLDKLKQAWVTSLANLPKRPGADPWALETTTAPEPGSGSVAEDTMDYARELIEKPPATAARIFYFHRQAGDGHDLDTDEGLGAAILEASGPCVSTWTDVPSIISLFRAGDADRAYLERVYLNRPVQAASQAFDAELFKQRERTGYVPAEGAEITLGFDGSRTGDGTGLVGTEVETGHQFVLGSWENPHANRPWEVDRADVHRVVSEAFQRFQVLRMYCDPEQWEGWTARWQEEHGDDVVLDWWTNRRKPMAYAIRAWKTALERAELTHDGDARLIAHVGHARVHKTGLRDEKTDQWLTVIRKDRRDSPRKIDLVVCAVLSWEARNDALAAGLAGARWGVVAV